ncbi:assimilatory sulfite reductase (NADPH) hemoprotein subunit [Oleiagrimonas sp. C23AA]|uniref:assimilatory sulfite reductase (NADPH) hemoprotein subunit n=1 Tax=Oleiagrimonas sp. C23AA TaxID=2719047 RepID=UPI0014232037|nr:assimilatory sulfite reductase (NADPH) hemoprotein subunit [Oleiagrimonas sp. C23AA]NII11498.1 assimilatory sulfite reductase (NADPH) hemoprotein subunit [Oleiagrimonas sp. C23AA]
MSTPASDMERVKLESRHLRGTIAQSLANPLTGAISEDDNKLLKFHGSYQQDDRDLREERRLQKLEPDYQFMIRARLPGGVLTPTQWLAFDTIADTYANGTLRITTRQTFQLHGVIKQQLKATMTAINASLIDTLAACGDVNRNVVASANPVQSQAHAEAVDWATKLSEHLMPRTGAYHELWLDGEKLADTATEHEPLYGDAYLPRKFKIGLAIPPDNDIDVFSQDLGLIAIIEDRQLTGFNVAVGGGMGATHNDPATYPQLADVIGFVPPEQLLETAWHIVAVQRDFGDRANRKHARLKYTIDDRGLDWFKTELQSRLGFTLAPARDARFTHNGDRYGWMQGENGTWHLTLHIPAGRVADVGKRRLKSGLRAIAEVHAGDLRMTCNQNVIIAGVAPADRDAIDALVAEYGLDSYATATPLRRHAVACVALPTCGMAMAEAERYLPALLDQAEALLGKHGLADAPILLRISGCPNGCPRPYLGEIALVGRALGRYDLRLGADFSGQRLNAVYRENIDEATIVAELDTLFARYAAERQANEGFGDFSVRAQLVTPPARRAVLETTS